MTIPKHIDEAISIIEEQMYQQGDGEISQTQINEIGRQLFDVYDNITGERRKFTRKQLHQYTHTRVLPE